MTRADKSIRMLPRNLRRLGFEQTAALVVMATVAAFLVYMLIQPACGAPGNTALGRSIRYVPFLLLWIQALAVVVIGWLKRCSGVHVTVVAFLSTFMTGAGGVLVWACWFTSGHCGD